MFRQIGIGAAAVLTAGVLAIGCSDDSGGDTIIGGGLQTTDNFPGSTIAENNVADDARAFSNQEQTFNFDQQIFWNVSNGQAIMMFSTTAVSNGNTLLYAAHWTGSSWSRPVQIRGRDFDNTPNVFQDPSSSVGTFRVVWLNTATTAAGSPEAAARHGDAVLLYTADDLAPNVGVGGTTDEDATTRLWMTYFDVSAATAPASGTIQGGFNTEAITVDDELIITGALNDPSVSTVAVVSDSLRCAHEQGTGTVAIDSGEPTTFLEIVYAKQESSTTGVRYHGKAIIGDAPTNDLDSLLDAEETLTGGVALSAAGDSVNDGVVALNDLLFWQANITSGTEPNETIVTVTRFDGDGVLDQELLGPNPIDNDSSDIVNMPAAADVYGADHGLASTDVVFTTSGFITDNAPTAGDTADDVDLYVARIDNDATLAVERAQIDNFADTITTTNPILVGVDISNVQTRMNRTGQDVFILFNQASTDAATDSTGAGNQVDELLYVTVFQTRRVAPAPGTTVTPARDILDSVYDDDTGTATVFEPLTVPSLVSTGTVATGDEAEVTEADFQIELVTGQAQSQLGTNAPASCELGCAIQSNANRVNFSYQQLVDNGTSGGTGVDEERLYNNGVIVVNGATATDNPDLDLVDTTAQIVATRDIDYGQEFTPLMADAGDVSRDATGAPTGDSGRAVTFYRLNQINPTDDSATGSFLETRAFVEELGQSELLSTDDVREFGQVQDGFRAITVPVNENVASAPHHAGTTLHVFFAENEDNGPASRIATRSMNKGAINDNDPANDDLADRFTPNLVGGTTPEAPVFIDNPTEGDLFTLGGGDLTVLRTGSTVGVYFDEDATIYYTDTASDARGWDTETGISAPQVVNNEIGLGLTPRVQQYVVVARPECDNLDRSMVLFDVIDLQQFVTGVRRLQVRVHN
jgi:hypothetical protein